MKRTNTKNLFCNLLAATGAVLALGASPAAAWELPVYLSDYGVDPYMGQKMAIDGKGRTVVAWRAATGMDETLELFIQAAIRPAGGTFGPATTISNPSADAVWFDIAASKKGTVTAIWDRGTDYDNRWLEVSDLGKKDVAFSSGTVFTPVNGAMYAQLGVDKKGNATVLWLQHTTGIVSTAYRKAGEPFGTPEVLSDSGNYNPVLAVGPKGNAVAAWSSDPEPDTIEAAIRPAGGEFAPRTVISDPTEDTDLIQIWMDDKGNSTLAARNYMMGDISADGVASDWFSIPFDRQLGAVVKWDKKGNQYALYTTFDYKAVLAVRPAGSTTFGAPIAVSDPAAFAGARDMIVDKKGNVRAIWIEWDGYNRVKTAYKPVGGVFDTPVQLSVPGIESAGARLAADRKGNVTATWLETDDTTHLSRVVSSYQPR